jgi:hypothetical protein
MGHAAHELNETHNPEPRGPSEAAPEGDVVRCVMSGAWVPRAEAIMVTLGPGRRRWIHRDFTNTGR